MKVFKFLSKSLLFILSGLTILAVVNSCSRRVIREELPAPGPGVIRVMTLNICYGAEDIITCSCIADRRAKIAELIANTKADIIGFQEANSHDNFIWIAEQIGHHYYWSPVPGEAGFNTGVMSRFPISGGEGIGLRNSAARAIIEITPTKSIHLVTLHLTPDTFGDDKRAEELSVVVNWIEPNLEANPHIVLGDFNTGSAVVLDPLIDAGFTAANKDDIDHIFNNQTDALRITAKHNLKDEFFSPWPTDHPAVLADFDVSGVW
jgi:endonuclease/exonuclease/phosphatase family metal-dependent hydrolase